MQTWTQSSVRLGSTKTKLVFAGWDPGQDGGEKEG